ncbi:MAG: M20/M25/M40 family metallo-hydrolase [Ignavibacteria bacterium]|nr:M20/M25/M40 family metallo-hydrolase [Ignavibacteria bacterium]
MIPSPTSRQQISRSLAPNRRGATAGRRRVLRGMAPLLLLTALLSPGLGAQNHFGAVTFDQTVQSTISTALRLDSLQNFVRQLSGVLPITINGANAWLPHRAAGSGSTQFRNAAQHIANVFERYGLSPVIENNASPWTKLNVVGTLPGRRAEYVVICGHFDSANNTCPGADDNGSGTSAVMEAARILRGLQFEYTIKFIAFGGEEQGMKGSQQYMTAHASDSIRAAINCDMIMWDGDTDRVLQIHAIANAGTQYSEDLADFIIWTNTTYTLPNVCSMWKPGITASDHSSFWNTGRSAVLLIEEYASDFNPYYHTGNDSWTTMNTPGAQAMFRNATKLTVASAMHLAQLVQPTPVTLASFTAEAEGRAALLRWSTASETNNAGFRIERAAYPSLEFEPVGYVPGNGTSAQAHEYRFLDTQAPRGKLLYRLRQVDTDGSEDVSFVASVTIGIDAASVELLATYPNPAVTSTTVAFSLPEAMTATLRVHDLLGRQVAELASGPRPAGMHAVPVSVAALRTGTYLLVLETPRGTASRRFSVMR